MFRLKIVLTFVISVLIVALTGYFANQFLIASAIDEDTEEALRRSASVAEQRRLLEEATMIAKAQFVAGGPDLYDAITADYMPARPESDDEEEEEIEEDVGAITAAERAEHERHLKVYERLLRYKKEFDLYYERGDGKTAREMDVPLQWRKPTQPDLYFAVDARGVGLAALGKDLLKWYGEDVSADYELISEVMVKQEPRTALWRWSFDPTIKPENRPLYLVALAPIKSSRTDDPVGVVVIGSLLNDGNAKMMREYMGGVAGLDLPQAEVDRVMRSVPHLAYYYNDQVIGSTLDTTAQSVVERELLGTQKILDAEGSEKLGELDIDDESYAVRARPFPGRAVGSDRAGFLVLGNETYAKKVLRDPGTYTILVGAIVGFIGMVLLLIFIQTYLKAFEKIESGVQEVIAGNKGYEFNYHGANRIATSLAQQLNLMAAFLQGKPMPDADDPAGGSWGALDPTSGQRSGSSQVQGVSMSDLMGRRPAAEDDPDDNA